MMKRRLDTHLALVFGLTVTLALVGIIYFVNNRAAAILEGATSTMFAQMTHQSRANIDDSFSNLNLMTAMFAADPQVQTRTPENEQALVRQFSLIMEAKPFTSAMYVGYDDGGFLLLRQLTSPVARRNLDAPDNARYLLQTIRNTAEGRETKFVFLDAALKPVGELDRPDFFYDPRNRRWYYDAFASDGAILTDPYRFFATAESGITIARRIVSNRGVMAVDLSLADLSEALRRMKNTPSSELIITDPNGAVIAASNPAAELPTSFQNSPSRGRVADAVSTVVPTMLTAVRDHDGSDQTTVISDHGRAWTMHVAPLRSGQWTFAMAVAMPQDEIMAGVRQIVTTLGWISLGLILVVIFAIRYTATAVSRPLVAIAEEAAAIQSFNFHDLPGNTRSSVTEIDTLSRAIQNARLTIRRFIEIGRALSAERDPDRLTRRLLKETISITSSETGFIFLSEDNGETFLMLRDPAGKVLGETAGEGEDAAAEQVLRLNDAATGTAARLLHALRRRDVSHFDLSDPDRDNLLASTTRGVPLEAGEVLRCSVIPLLNRADEVIGGLLLCSPTREDTPISNERLELARALSGNAAVAIETTLLLKSRKKLLDAVIRMIALATDAKSPYTNGHCQRVPLITHALAQAACDTRDGPYADFDLTPEEWEAVDVASWLHDCGKLTTAEYVVDKATKLETITDRIHEIRMRFELLKAQAETDYWRALANGGHEAELRAERDRQWRELDEDFAFVASCNEGGEFMEPQKIERLRKIARRQWTRTLSDRIGISTEERRRKERVPDPPLPVKEDLLADRPDQVIEHFANQLDDFETKAGFTLTRPDHRLNQGELHNLSIGRGTLTEEERYEINRHITRTILMLEGLPLAGPLAAVPEYAGGHHEKMDGTGYPRGLVRDELSPVARMMAIADVFEALTAGDRPYKKAKTLSEAIRIMGFMKRDGHLDPDLLDLFLSSGIWRDYAREHLVASQIDEPDIASVLATHPVQRAA